MLTKTNKITSCVIGPAISPENFIEEHFFLFLGKGKMLGYDGGKNYILNSGESCIVRKNHLARYGKQKDGDDFEKVIVIFDEAFLRYFQEKYKVSSTKQAPREAFHALNKNVYISNFVSTLQPYYDGAGRLDQGFSDLKREELLLVLLKEYPELTDIFFDFGKPEKIDIEAFMNRNFRFNVAVQRFAYLTGRSITSFKNDFKQVFNDTPSHWLIKKRLQEAYFLIDKKGQRASDVYLEVGLEDLSHFSFAFKKLFGITPTQLAAQRKKSSV